MYFHYVMITYSSYESMSHTLPTSTVPKLHLPKGKERDRMGNLASGCRRIAGKVSKFQVRFNEHRLSNVWLLETLLMSSVDPGVERNYFYCKSCS